MRQEVQAREPVVAGRFYPADEKSCRAEARRMLREAKSIQRICPEGNWFGAVIPHAGWICSGEIAAEGIAFVAKCCAAPDLVVLFGAVHTMHLAEAALDSHATWALPSGSSEIALALQDELLKDREHFRLEPGAHRGEHAIEVELPLVQAAWPGVPILPIEVPPIESAPEIGRRTARVIGEQGKRAVYLASSDLTHYGPDYGLMPAGIGGRGLHWAMENDRRLLERITRLKAEAIVQETQENSNACGGGAVAALLGACEAMGATRALVLEHTNSYEVLSRKLGRESAENAVGYAAVVIG